MAEEKPSRQPDVNVLQNPTDRNKGQDSKTKKYRGKKPQNKPIPNTRPKTDFNGRCTDLEGYIFDLGPRTSYKLAQTMEELEKYLRATYRDRCQPFIMTETLATSPKPEIPKIIPDSGINITQYMQRWINLRRRTSMSASAKI